MKARFYGPIPYKTTYNLWLVNTFYSVPKAYCTCNLNVKICWLRYTQSNGWCSHNLHISGMVLENKIIFNPVRLKRETKTLKVLRVIRHDCNLNTPYITSLVNHRPTNNKRRPVALLGKWQVGLGLKTLNDTCIWGTWHPIILLWVLCALVLYS